MHTLSSGVKPSFLKCDLELFKSLFFKSLETNLAFSLKPTNIEVIFPNSQNLACSETLLKENKHNRPHHLILKICPDVCPWTSKLTVFLELHSRKTDRFSEQQCPRIYIRAYLSSHQIEAFGDICDHCLKSFPVLKHQPNKVFIRSDQGFRFERKIQEEQKIAQPYIS